MFCGSLMFCEVKIRVPQENSIAVEKHYNLNIVIINVILVSVKYDFSLNMYSYITF
jgi:hypothetical protein